MLLVLATVPGLTPGPAAAATTGVLRRWGATAGGSQAVTAAQAVADAKSVDILMGLPHTFGQYTAQMRAANPSLKFIYYLNGAYAGNKASSYPESWFLHDAKGNRVISKNFHNMLMDVTNPAWVQNRLADCSTTIAQLGWDGCYLDMLGGASANPSYVVSMPINQSTGREWTTPDWIAATTALAHSISTALPQAFIAGNGMGSGSLYFDPAMGPSSTLFNGVAGGDAENFIRSEYDPVTKVKNEADWKLDVDMLVEAGQRGKSVMPDVELWATGYSQAQKDSVHRYALASFLLGTNGNQYWYWSDTGQQSAVVEDSSYEHVNIGQPIGAYAKMDGAYQRRYSGGLVAVNPGTTSVTIPLASGRWTTLAGASVQGQLTLQPHTGDVLTTAGPWGPLPTVTTGPLSNLSPVSATISATVNANGLATTVRGEYGTDATLGTVTAATDAGAGTTDTPVQITLTGLKPGATYTYHLDVTNTAGTNAGADLNFTTPLPAPTAGTGGGVATDPTHATVSGSVNPNGLATTYHADFGPDTSYGASSVAQPAGSGTKTIAETMALSGLPVGRVVHYRLVASNSTATTYGTDRTLAMPPPPAAVTQAATIGAGKTTATLHATVNPNGTDTHYQFEWGTTTAYDRTTTTGNAGSTRGGLAVTASIQGLARATTYHYRIDATNPSGTTLGTDRTFTIR